MAVAGLQGRLEGYCGMVMTALERRLRSSRSTLDSSSVSRYVVSVKGGFRLKIKNGGGRFAPSACAPSLSAVKRAALRVSLKSDHMPNLEARLEGNGGLVGG